METTKGKTVYGQHIKHLAKTIDMLAMRIKKWSGEERKAYERSIVILKRYVNI